MSDLFLTTRCVLAGSTVELILDVAKEHDVTLYSQVYSSTRSFGIVHSEHS